MARAAAIGRCATAASSEFVNMAGQATHGPAVRHRRTGRTWRSIRGWTQTVDRSTQRPMTCPRARLIVWDEEMSALRKWFGSSWIARGVDGEDRAPLEAIAWRCTAVVLLAACIAATVATHPRPGVDGRHAVILAAFVAMVAAAIVAHPERRDVPQRQVVLALVGVIVAAGVLGGEQPHGIWIVGPYFAVIVGALKLDRRRSWLLLAIAVIPFLAGYLAKGQIVGALGFLSGILPWFFAMRLLRYVSDQRDELRASREAEAKAAAAAERGRLSRE